MARYNIAEYTRSFITKKGLLKDNIPKDIYELARIVIHANCTGYRKTDALERLDSCLLETNSRAKRYGYCAYRFPVVIQLHERIMPVPADHPDYRWFVKEYQSVLRHEIAHLIAHYGCGESGHGATWKKIAIAMGDDGGRCGDGLMFGYDEVSKVYPNPKPVEYSCQDCGKLFCRSRRWAGTPRHHIECHKTKMKFGGYLLLTKHPDATATFEARQAFRRQFDLAWDHPVIEGMKD